MEHLDRLGWAAGLSFLSYGVRVGIRVNDRSALDLLPEYLPPERKRLKSSIVDTLYSLRLGNSTPGSKVRSYNLLYTGNSLVCRTMVLSEVLDSLESTMRFQVALSSEQRLFIHAGVVGWRGRAIVIPGASFSGKTSLVAALVRAGATYYSDEFAVFDSHGLVHPYLKPLNMREHADQSAK